MVDTATVKHAASGLPEGFRYLYTTRPGDGFAHYVFQDTTRIGLTDALDHIRKLRRQMEQLPIAALEQAGRYGEIVAYATNFAIQYPYADQMVRDLADKQYQAYACFADQFRPGVQRVLLGRSYTQAFGRTIHHYTRTR